MSFYCDWCGEGIDSKFGLMTITVSGSYEEGGVGGLVHDERRHFHGGVEGDEQSCVRQALAHLDARRPASPRESAGQRISEYYDAWSVWPSLPSVEREHRILNALGADELLTREIALRLSDEQNMIVRNRMIVPMLAAMAARGDLEREKRARTPGGKQLAWCYRRPARKLSPELQSLEDRLRDEA